MRRILVGLVLVAGTLLAACQTPSGSTTTGAAPATDVVQTNQPATSVPLSTLSIAATPTAASSAQASGLPTTGDGQRPLFIGVVQTIGMKGNSTEKAAVTIPPVAFSYDLDNRILLVHPTISLASLKADVIIGVVTEVDTPSATYEKREIKLLPFQLRAMQILGADLTTGVLNFTYDSKPYTLDPGQSLSFDQPGTTANPATISTVIFNHGELSGIQTMPETGTVP